MIFSSYEFILFLAVTTVIFYALERSGRHGYQLSRSFLLVASFVFYAWWQPRDVPFFAGTIVVNFLFGAALRRLTPGSGRRKATLFAGLAANLIALAWFKYPAFIAGLFAPLVGADAFEVQPYLPLAISFFTFTQIAYLVDVYRSEVPRYRLRDYALFVSYFPHLIAGPIVHHNELMPQLVQRVRSIRIAHHVAVGGTLFVIGLAKKVLVADNLAPFADTYFDSVASGAAPGLIDSWMGVSAYYLQIYFDFSGYSDMACGAAFLLGFRLPINFYSPYRATSLIDFWRRWHITLSRFLRDFLYIPLGGNRRGPGRRYLNLMVTMILGGLWHGAGWTFIVWGALHGLLLAANHALRAVLGALGLRPSGAAWVMAAWLATQIAVMVAWVFFRSDDLTTAGGVLGGMAGAGGIGAPLQEVGRISLELGSDLVGSLDGTLILVGLLIAWLAPNSAEIMRSATPFIDPTGVAVPRRQPQPAAAIGWTPSPGWAFSIALLATASLLSLFRVTPFLYFQF